ncbi:nuclear transport factor 2 family protein [Spirochaeta africana]|uniref:histidine kinase n=1 Tax=Spirochaeta africana (strain ATCC 700263 / DSM 8902 / Z-7692) TaxID=889378 RepID=H9UL19_SPIAZ|nr:nuclear transport factor 2 family protein [Spirochaeta africana]AFG38212.1 signal transduction histidine kinase [Spirochaeta africana DSM 8902]
MNTDAKLQELRACWLRYLDAYLSQRNLEAISELVGPGIHGVGTALDELAFSREASLQLFQRDIAQAANPIAYTIRKEHLSIPSATVGLVVCELDLTTEMLGQQLKLNHMRMSLVFVRTRDDWLLEHIHVSFPAELHGPDESYPYKELEERAAILQREVTERTARLQHALAQKDILMRELHHRVKNNLSLVSSLIGLSDLNSADDVADIRHRIKAIGLVHDKLFQLGTADQVPLREYLQDLLQTVFGSLATRPIEIQNQAAEIELPSHLAIPLGLLVNELATNAIKYGFTDESPAWFLVQLEPAGPGEIRAGQDIRNAVLRVTNSGPPFPDGVSLETAESMGLRLVQAMAEQLGGQLELTRKPRPLFTVTFPA